MIKIIHVNNRGEIAWYRSAVPSEWHPNWVKRQPTPTDEVCGLSYDFPDYWTYKRSWCSLISFVFFFLFFFFFFSVSGFRADYVKKAAFNDVETLGTGLSSLVNCYTAVWGKQQFGNDIGATPAISPKEQIYFEKGRSYQRKGLQFAPTFLYCWPCNPFV